MQIECDELGFFELKCNECGRAALRLLFVDGAMVCLDCMDVEMIDGQWQSKLKSNEDQDSKVWDVEEDRVHLKDDIGEIPC